MTFTGIFPKHGRSEMKDRKSLQKRISLILILTILINYLPAIGLADNTTLIVSKNTSVRPIELYLNYAGIGLADSLVVLNNAGVPTINKYTFSREDNSTLKFSFPELLPNVIYCFRGVSAYREGVLLGSTSSAYPIYLMQDLDFEVKVLDEIPEFDPNTLEKKVGHRPKVEFKWSKIRIQKDPSTLQPGEDENTSVPIADSLIKNYKISIDAGNGVNIPLMVLPPDPTSSNPDRRNNYIVIRDGDDMDNPQWYKIAKSDENTISFVWHDDETAPENDDNPAITDDERFPVGFRPVPGKKYTATITPNTYNDYWNSGLTIYSVKNGYFYTNIKYSIVLDGYDNINIIVDKILDENESTTYEYVVDIAQYGPDEYYDDVSYTEEELLLKEQAFNNKIVRTLSAPANGKTREKLYFVIPKESAAGNHTYRITATSGIYKAGSKMMVYSDALGSDRPIVPQGVVVEQIIPIIENNSIVSADVLISWDKPSNYDVIKDTILYHIQLNTQEEEKLDPETLEYLKDVYGYKIGYREAKVIGIAANDEEFDKGKGFKYREDTKRIYFLIKGQELFKNPDGSRIAEPNPKLDDFFAPEDMPFQPGRTYFIRMYSTTTTGYVNKNDFSVPISITIPADKLVKPSVPGDFSVRLDVNGNEMVTTNEINLSWDKITYSTATGDVPDSAISYEIFIYTGQVKQDQNGNMQFDSDAFKQIAAEDIEWSDSGVLTETEMYARISTFDPDRNQAIVSELGTSLQPNTTYYFKIRARVKTDEVDITSDFSYILPVTTRRVANPPDDKELIPTAPTDFALDSSAQYAPNPASTEAVFSWSRLADELLESKVSYRILATELPIGKDDSLEKILNNNERYKLYKDYWEDLQETPGTALGGDCSFALVGTRYLFRAKGLKPNTVYYFSIRREVVLSDGSTVVSSWYTIPVTTTLLEPATDLVVTDELTDYIPIRDKQHEIRVRWKAKSSYMYNMEGSFIFYVKPDSPTTDPSTGRTSDEYVLWPNVKFIKSVLIENPDGTPSGYCWYYADVIGLESNTKYYIKLVVRDPATGMTSQEAGPAIGRTEFSQEDEYSDIALDAAEKRFAENIKKLKNAWLLIFNYSGYTYAKVDGELTLSRMDSTSGSSFLIDLTDTGYRYQSGIRLMIPYSIFREAYTRDISIVIRMKEREFCIRPGALDYKLVPGLDEMIADLYEPSHTVKEVYVFLEFADFSVTNGTINGNKIITDPINVSTYGVSYRYTDSYIEGLIDSIIDSIAREFTYSTGKFRDMLRKKADEIYRDKYYSYAGKYSEDEAAQMATSALLKAVDEWFTWGMNDPYMIGVKERLAEEVYEAIIDIDNYYILEKSSFTEFASSWLVKLAYSHMGKVQVMYHENEINSDLDDAKNGKGWSRLYLQSPWLNGTLSFDLDRSGILAITQYNYYIRDLEKDMADYDLISEFAQNYEIDTVLNSEGFIYPQDSLKAVDMMRIIRKVANLPLQNNTNLVMTNTQEELGLSGILINQLPYREITRQEAAAILMKIYERQAGVSLNRLKPLKVWTIADADKINKNLFNLVELSIDFRIFALDGARKFRPEDTITRGEFIAAFQKMLWFTRGNNRVGSNSN